VRGEASGEKGGAVGCEAEEIPNSRFQIPNKVEKQNSKSQTRAELFGIWWFVIGYCLEFRI
jgi:hypothetical protein